MIYLDNGATSGTKPHEVIEEVIWALENSANPSRSGHDRANALAEKVFETRELLGQLIGYNHPDRIAFTKNCTESLNLAIYGTLKPKGHVITTENEHNSVLRPLHYLACQGLIELTVLSVKKRGIIDINELKRAIKTNTYLVVMTHVSNVTGAVNPIAEVGEYLSDKNIIFLVDAAQSGGYIDIDMERMKIDILALPGHKGLLAPMGLGFIVVRQGITVQPLLRGGTGVDSLSMQQNTDMPESLEAGTLPVIAIVGASASLQYVLNNREITSKRMAEFDEILYNGTYKEAIHIYSMPNGVGIFSFSIDGYTSSEVANILNEKYHIAVRSGLTCSPLIHKRMNTWENGLVRASFSSFNTVEECNIFIDAINEIADNGK